MSAHRYKQVVKPRPPRAPQRPRGYHPVAAVIERGDQWRQAVPYGGKGRISAGMGVTLRDETFDRHEMFQMTLMERGVIPRCEFIGRDRDE